MLTAVGGGLHPVREASREELANEEGQQEHPRHPREMPVAFTPFTLAAATPTLCIASPNKATPKT
eukprot:119688-Prymnesium_polylepis.3